MEAPKRAPNLFELLNQVEKLQQQIDLRDKRIIELDQQLKLSRPDADEEQRVAPKGFWKSQVGRGVKDAYSLVYTIAREQDGYVAFSNRELGEQLGISPRRAGELRENMRALGLVEYDDLADYNPRTGVYRMYVRKAAEAWERVKRTPVRGNPQTSFLDDQEGSRELVGSVDSRVGRMAPAQERTRRAVVAQQPPVPASAPPAAVQNASAVTARKPPTPPPKVGGYRAQTAASAVTARKPPSVPDGVSPARGSAPVRTGAPDTYTRHFEKSTPKKLRASESVQCKGAPEDLTCAQTPSAGNLGDVLSLVVFDALDGDRQTERAAEIARLMEELIRLGGIAPPRPGVKRDSGRLHPKAARKIARAVVSGWIDWEGDVLRLLDDGAAKALADPQKTPAPWVYLVGTMKRRIFPERERPWDDTPRKPR